MISQSFLPSPALREYVRTLHLRHFEFTDLSQPPFKPYHPRPEQCLTFYPRAPEIVEYITDGAMFQRPPSIITGQYTFRTNRHIAKDFIVLIVEFQPGVLYRITGIPLYELTNTDLDAEAVFPGEIKSVNRRLNSCADYDEMIAIVETFLLRAIRILKKNFHPIDDVSKVLISHPNKYSLDMLAKKTYLCPRQFERKFKERMGIGPKTFARIARLHQTYKMKVSHPGEDWLSIALACGYHDYQHLVKDYKIFANTTPTAFFQEDAPEKHLSLQETF